MSAKSKPVILFDARHIANQYSGLGRYTFSILYTLLNLVNLYEKILIIICKKEFNEKNKDYHIIFEKIITNNKAKIIFVKSPLFGLQHHIILPIRIFFIKHDIFFYPHFDLPFLYFGKSIFVIHDLKYLKIKNLILRFEKIKKIYFKNAIKFNIYKKKTQCICVSNSTKKDILEIVNNKTERKIHVIYEDTFIVMKNNSIIREDIIELLRNNINYIFYIGDRRPHKNLKRTIDIFNILVNNYQFDGSLIIAGSTKNYDFDIESYIANNNKIILIGNVNDKELEKLYMNMFSLIYLSKYEGFGLPILEAAKYKKKIVSSNNSSLPEVCPPSALLIDLNENNSLLAQKIAQYFTKKISLENDSSHLAKFSWEKSVQNIFGHLFKIENEKVNR